MKRFFEVSLVIFFLEIWGAFPVLALSVPTYNSSGKLYYYHQDNLSSNSVMTDETGAVVNTSKYYGYGDERAKTGTKIGERTYTDQIKDDSSNLMYYNARYYNAQLGIFTQPDQIGGIGKYAYASGNPIRYSDPGGNMASDEGGGGKCDTSDPSCMPDQPPPPPSLCAGEGMSNNPCQPNRTYYPSISQQASDTPQRPSNLFTKADERFRVELNGEVNNPNPDFSFGGPYGTENLNNWFNGFENEIYWGMSSDDDYTRSLYYDRAVKWLSLINANVSDLYQEEWGTPSRVFGTTWIDQQGRISIQVAAFEDETGRLGTLYHEGIHAFKAAKDSVQFNGQSIFTTNKSTIPGYRWDQENTAYGLEHQMWNNIYDRSQSPYIVSKPDSRTMDTIIHNDFNSAMGEIMSSLFLDISAPMGRGAGHRGF